VALAYVTRRVRRGAARDLDASWTARIGVRERGSDRVSVFAEPRFVAGEAVALATLAPIRPRERLAVLLAPLVAGALGGALKRLVPRERPAKHRFDPKGGQSFPSTHAAGTTALGLVTASVARRHDAGAWCFAPALAVGALIGVERIRGAAHWPSDVLAGWLLGIVGATTAHLLVLGGGRGKTR